jgi:hypothetical protein
MQRIKNAAVDGMKLKRNVKDWHEIGGRVGD